MVQGIFLVGWDNAIGPTLDRKFPEDKKIEFGEILQYLMTVQAIATSKNINIQDSNRSVLIYGIPTTSKTSFNYGFIVVILDKDEFDNTERYKLLLKTYGEKILKSRRTERSSLFDEFCQAIFYPKPRKIVFIGLPNAGKTTTKLFMFEKLKEEQLLTTTIQPTQGFETNTYDFLDLNISLFDTSGQELPRWFGESRDVLFSSDLLVFFFSVEDWNDNEESIVNYLRKFSEISKSNKNTKVICFCHKFDLVEEDKRVDFKKRLLEHIKDTNLSIFFTTIQDGGNQDLIIGMQFLIAKFSDLFINFTNLLDPLMKEFKLHPVFLYNSDLKCMICYDKEFGRKIELNRINNLLPKVPSLDLLDLSTLPQISALKLPEIEDILVFLNVSGISGELSYLIMTTKDFKQIDDFRFAYNKIADSFDYRIDKFNNLSK